MEDQLGCAHDLEIVYRPKYEVWIVYMVCWKHKQQTYVVFSTQEQLDENILEVKIKMSEALMKACRKKIEQRDRV